MASNKEKHATATSTNESLKPESQGGSAAQPESADYYYMQGFQHYLGKGVEKNEELAFSYFEQAARLGHVDAKRYLAQHYFRLGMKYYEGDGVGKDLDQAAGFLRKARNLDYGYASKPLADCYYELGMRQLRGRGKEREAGVDYLRRAKNLGHSKARETLAEYYYEQSLRYSKRSIFRPFGNSKKATEYSRMAANLGHAASKNNLEYGVQKDWQNASAWYNISWLPPFMRDGIILSTILIAASLIFILDSIGFVWIIIGINIVALLGLVFFIMKESIMGGLALLVPTVIGIIYGVNYTLAEPDQAHLFFLCQLAFVAICALIYGIAHILTSSCSTSPGTIILAIVGVIWLLPKREDGQLIDMEFIRSLHIDRYIIWTAGAIIIAVPIFNAVFKRK